MSEIKATEKFQVACRGSLANVEIEGSGPNVVMVGTAAPMALTAPACHILAEAGYRVLNFDYQAPDGWVGVSEPRSALDQVSDVIDVMAAAGMESAHVVGFSRGAMTAYPLAYRRPDLVRKLVLAFPVAGYADTIDLEDPTPGDPGSSEAADPMAAVLESVFSPAYLNDHGEHARRLLLSPPGTVDRLERGDEERFGDHQPVACATLVMEGGRDRVVSSQHPRRYLNSIPDARGVLVETATHGWILEEPEGFAAIVADFLAEGLSAD